MRHTEAIHIKVMTTRGAFIGVKCTKTLSAKHNIRSAQSDNVNSSSQHALSSHSAEKMPMRSVLHAFED